MFFFIQRYPRVFKQLNIQKKEIRIPFTSSTSQRVNEINFEMFPLRFDGPLTNALNISCEKTMFVLNNFKCLAQE